MNHMNIFHNYKDLEMSHEDILTRNFLLLLNYIPQYCFRFFELLNIKMLQSNSYKPLVFDEVEYTEVKTQVNYNDNWLKSFEGLDVVSVLISNEEIRIEEQIKGDDYKHRYDGVIKTPNTVFIIENKPNMNNVWRQQLDINIGNSNNILKDICSIKWSDIISFSNTFLKGNILSNVEKHLIEDFIQYIDEYYPELNPYTNFSLCKNEEILYKKRCNKILGSLIEGVNISYHNGWDYKIDSGNYEIPQIALKIDMNEKENFIGLVMVAGDSMARAKSMFEKIDIQKTKRLLEDKGFDIYKNFHIAAFAKNRFYSDGDIELFNYINYWKNELENDEIKQISRENDKSHFDSYYKKLVDNRIVKQSDYNKLVDNRIVKQSDYNKFKEEFIDKGYQVMNICPSIEFNYWWNKEKAIELDVAGKFVDEVKEKMNMIFDVLNK